MLGRSPMSAGRRERVVVAFGSRSVQRGSHCPLSPCSCTAGSGSGHGWVVGVTTLLQGLGAAAISGSGAAPRKDFLGLFQGVSRPFLRTFRPDVLTISCDISMRIKLSALPAVVQDYTFTPSCDLPQLIRWINALRSRMVSYTRHLCKA